MNRQWWAGPVEAFIYNEFADALREGMRTGVLQFDDLMADDAFVLERLDCFGKPVDRRKTRERAFSAARAGASLLAAHHSQGALARPAGAGKRHDQAAFAAGTELHTARAATRITNDRECRACSSSRSSVDGRAGLGAPG